MPRPKLTGIGGGGKITAALIRTTQLLGAWTSFAQASDLLESSQRHRAVLLADRAFVIDHGDQPVTICGGFAAVRLASPHVRRHERLGILHDYGLRIVPGPQFVERSDRGFEVVLPVLPVTVNQVDRPYCAERLARRR